MATDDPPPETPEAIRVLDWRLHEFTRCGCTELLAIELAASEVDLHEFADLVAHGCNCATAARILG